MKVSGVIGVVFITVIVIIVAAFTFAHVESIREQQLEKKNRSIQGWVQEINESNSIFIDEESYSLYTVHLSNKSESNTSVSYNMVFVDTYPPYRDLHLKFYYDPIVQNNVTIYVVTFIEQIS